MSRVVALRLDLIDPGPNVRPQVDPDLFASMQELGLLQPITVVKDGRRYQVLYGHRRFEAARALRWKTIPAIVEPKAPAQLGLAQIAENIDRRGLMPMDIARALAAELEADPKLTHRDLAKRLGRKPAWISNKLALLRLPEPVQERIEAGELNEFVALRGRAPVADGRGRPAIVSEPDEQGRSKSIHVEIGHAAGRGRVGLFVIGVDHEARTVDLVVEAGDRRVFLTVAPDEAKLLGRRFTQAWEAIA